MFRELPIVARNAIKDMIDEWVLSLCIILSVSAIACPLLILFALKQGYVETIRDHFIKDPVFRQITPKATVEYAADFFETIEKDERVDLIIPSITSSASVAQVLLADGERTRNIDVHPTIEGDPLLQLNDSVVPGKGEVVVTDALAKLLEVSVGDTITLAISRRYNKKKQTAEEALRVVGVLSARANNSQGLYLTLGLTRDIENFRFGRHVERPNWPEGELPLTREIYDAIIIGCSSELDDNKLSKVSIRTDFKTNNLLGVNGHQQFWPFAEPSDLIWYEFTATGGPVGQRAIKLLKSEIRGQGCVNYIPWVNSRTVNLGGKQITLLGLSVKETARSVFPIAFPEQKAPFGELQKIVLSAELEQANQDNVELNITTETSALQLSLDVVDNGLDDTGEIIIALLKPDIAVVPAEFLARLRMGDEYEIQFDASTDEIIVGDLGFSGFRLYANSIDDVPELAADIQRLGNVSVHARTDDIVRVKLLEKSLNKIVFLIAVVGLVGGAGALIANLVASVERKKAQMGTYRLIGFNRLSVALFPVFQGLLISVCAAAIAGAFYLLFGGIVESAVGAPNNMAAGPDDHGVVRLSFVQFAIFTLGMALLSLLCASVAARRSLRIDPAEALRQE